MILLLLSSHERSEGVAVITIFYLQQKLPAHTRESEISTCLYVKVYVRLLFLNRRMQQCENDILEVTLSTECHGIVEISPHPPKKDVMQFNIIANTARG